MLSDVFEKNEAGFGEWKDFIENEYYENYLEPKKTMYQLCEINDPNQAIVGRPWNRMIDFEMRKLAI